MENFHIEELKFPHVHIEDPDRVIQVVNNIIAGGCDELQVVSDFDFTLSKFAENGKRCSGCHRKRFVQVRRNKAETFSHIFTMLERDERNYNFFLSVVADFDRTLSKYVHKGKVCATCHNVLEEGGVLPEDFKVKARDLRDHYFPIETNPQLSIEEKIPIMVEWWTQAHALLSSYPITKSGISEMVLNSTAKLRDGCPWLFDQLDTHNIPLLIFSAGVGDVIEEVIRQQSQFHQNMRVVSNYIDFDEEGKMIGFKGDLIHVYNKNESSIHDSDYFKNLSHRHNVILIGDSLGDLHMADGATGVKNKLKIGFLNVKVEESLELYKKKFDIVIVQDETLDVVNALMRSILQVKN